MSMINEQAMFASVVKRLFSGNPQEILGELLQNSQRAGASEVHVTFPRPTCCCYRDNGAGLAGLEAFRALLVLAESLYEEQVIANQEPMGIGLYSLIVHDQVERVSVDSNGLRLTLDTRRWLRDQRYRESWGRRIRTHSTPDAPTPPRFQLTITAQAGFIEALKQRLCSADADYSYPYERFFERVNPAWGFDGLLRVFVDGQPIEARMPEELTLAGQQDTLARTYLGNTIYLAPVEEGGLGGGLVVNWYGQLVPTHGWSGSKWKAYLVVRAGKPVTPMAPSRKGLVSDAKLAELWGWIEDTLFAWVYTMDAPPPRLVKWCYHANAERAARECPFAVIQRWKPYPPTAAYATSSYDNYTYGYGSAGDLEFDDTTEETYEVGPEEVIRKDPFPPLLLLDKGVTCALQGKHPVMRRDYSVARLIEQDPAIADRFFKEEFEIGLNFFLRAAGLPAAFRPVAGISPDLVRRFWWRPGLPEDGGALSISFAPGAWGLQDFAMPEDEATGVDLITWNPFVTLDERLPLFVASDTDDSDMGNLEWVIALRSREQIIPFLREYPWLAYSPDDERDSDECWDDYNASIEHFIRCYLGDAVDPATSLQLLETRVKEFLPQTYRSRIRDASYRLLFKRDGSLAGLEVTLPAKGKRQPAFKKVLQCV